MICFMETEYWQCKLKYNWKYNQIKHISQEEFWSDLVSECIQNIFKICKDTARKWSFPLISSVNVTFTEGVLNENFIFCAVGKAKLKSKTKASLTFFQSIAVRYHAL